MYEFTAAMKGYLSSKGIKFVEPVTRNEFLSMVAEDEARGR